MIYLSEKKNTHTGCQGMEVFKIQILFHEFTSKVTSQIKKNWRCSDSLDNLKIMRVNNSVE